MVSLHYLLQSKGPKVTEIWRQPMLDFKVPGFFPFIRMHYLKGLALW
jgi:hypothetical protein